jgi:S1-C subfamily serine protease
LKLGEWVLAIGNPYNLTSTVTAGIVSAKARNLFVNDSDFRIESFIQTDAAVNTGNSGGALLNAKGEIVGINTVIKSPTGSYAGYSFAVPSSIVSKIVADMREFGDVRRGVLGVSMAEITDDFIRKMGTRYQIDEVEGVLVVAVLVGSAAQDAGIKPGDVILEVSGVKTNSPSQVQEIIARLRPDDKIKLLIKRGSEMKHFDVVLRNKNVRGN